MEKNDHMAKNIADVAWNMFIEITGSKAEEAGSLVGPGEPQKHLSAMFQTRDGRRKDTL
ncbi:MAG: hypothetical protein PHQ81_07380 [Methanofollis sp.]|nr:hypothetical protein [Methanofollis sp.]